MHIQPFKPTLIRFDRIFTLVPFLEKIKNLFPIFYKSGYFKKSNEPAMFIYMQVTQGKENIGLITATKVEDYLNGNIIKHEQTLAIKEQKMQRLFKERHGQVKPVLLTYPSVEAIKKLLLEVVNKQDPDWFVDYKEGQHRFWKITNTKILNQLTKLFLTNVPKAYIADGHHRAATMAGLYQDAINRKLPPKITESYNSILCAFFDTDDLQISDYNRVVKLEQLKPVDLLKKLEQVVDIQVLTGFYKPIKKHELSMWLDGKWYKLTWKKSVLPSEEEGLKAQLDVTLLNQLILNDILNIEEVRTDRRIAYVDGLKGVPGLITKIKAAKGNAVGFMMYPISTEEFMYIADNEGVMPPKSTFFLPRIHNGFVTLMFD